MPTLSPPPPFPIYFTLSPQFGPPATPTLSTGRTGLPPHPRLRVNDSHLAVIRGTIRTDPTAKAYFEGLVVYGESLLAVPSVNCSLGLTSSRVTLTIE